MPMTWGFSSSMCLRMGSGRRRTFTSAPGMRVSRYAPITPLGRGMYGTVMPLLSKQGSIRRTLRRLLGFIPGERTPRCSR